MKVFLHSALDSLLTAAAQSPRLRQHLNIHASYNEPCQRLFNALCVESYIRPHRHLLDGNPECLIAVRGVFALIVFDDVGGIVRIVHAGTESRIGPSGAVGVEIEPGVWHTVVALVPDTVVFEVKNGPFDPLVAKELASWAPEEGCPDVARYHRWLRDQVRG